MNVTFDFVSTGEFADFVLETDGSLQSILANPAHEKREKVIKAITEASRKYADKNTGNKALV